jgi:hypothetical protein
MKKLILLLTITSLSCLWGMAFSASTDRIQKSGPESKPITIEKKLSVQRPGTSAVPSHVIQAPNRLMAHESCTANQLEQQKSGQMPILLFDSTIPSINNIPSTPAPETPLVTPVNDNCGDVIPVLLTGDSTLTFSRNNAGATPDCPYLGPPEVWEAITINECMDVVLDFCGSTPVFHVVFGVIAASCPCGTLIPNSGITWTDCPDFNGTVRYSALAPGTYYIPIASFGPSVGDYTLHVNGYVCPPPATNDNCADAIPIGDVNNLRFTTRYATFDGLGTCITSPNIWYIYTASCTGNATASLIGSNYDTKIAVYDGASCNPLGNLLNCNDDFGGAQSVAIFPVVSGQQYLIEIGGSGANVGNGWLSTSCSPKPANDDCVNVTPVLLTPGTPLVINGTNAGSSNDCPVNSFYPEVWEAITTNVCMDVTIDYCGTSPVFGNVYGIINTGCPCEGLIYSSAMHQECPDGNWRLYFTALPAGTYYIPILADQQHGFYGPYTMNINGTACPVAPPNDNCDAVTPEPLFEGSPLTFTGDNTGATLDCQNLTAPEVWHAFTTYECMNVTVDYCGTDPLFSRYYIVLADACPCGALITAYQYEFYSCPNGSPTIKFADLPAGTYYLPVYTEIGSMGPYTINVSGVPCLPVPANDDCANATEVSVPSSTLGNTLSAGWDDAPVCFTAILSPGVWYKLLGTGNEMTASTCNDNTDYDTRLNIYSGTCGQLECVAGNDNNCGLPVPHNGGSSVTFCTVQGVEYYILVQGFLGDLGAFQLDISEGEPCQPPPPTPTCDAQSLYGQSPTGPGGYWNFLNSDLNNNPTPYLVQDNFSNVSGDICQLKFWGIEIYFNISYSNCNENPAQFEIKFYEDNGGVPGAVTNTYNATVVGAPTGLMYEIFELKEYTVTLSPCATIPNGWISIQGVGVGGDPGDCLFYWANSQGGDGICYQNGATLTEDAAFCLAAAGGCPYLAGDINGNGQTNGIDVTYGVGYFKGGAIPPVRCDMCPQPAPFYAAGDVNGSCVYNGIDITFFVGYLKGQQPGLLYCPTCPPAGLSLGKNTAGPSIQPLKSKSEIKIK